MAKEELFRNPIMNWFLRYVHTFPVHRGRIDKKAIVESFRVLKSGGVLGIFPEGTRKCQGILGPFHDGFAGIAIKAGVPVLPAVVVNSRAAEENGTRTDRIRRTGHAAGNKKADKEAIRQFFRRNSGNCLSYAKSAWRDRKMKVTIAEACGFCYGVRRAVDMASQAETGTKTLGPIIHNPQVVARLSAQGVAPVDSLDEVGDGETVPDPFARRWPQRL